MARKDSFDRLLLDLQMNGLHLTPRQRSDTVRPSDYGNHTMFVLLQLMMSRSFPLDWSNINGLACIGEHHQ